MATPDEMRQATVAAQASYERAINHAGQAQAHCQEAAGGIGALLPLLEQAATLRTQFDDRIHADRARAGVAGAKQEEARGTIVEAGIIGTTNPSAEKLIGNTQTIGEIIGKLSGTLARAEGIAEQAGGAALAAYHRRLGNQEGQVREHTVDHLNGAKAGYRKAIEEAQAYQGRIDLAEAAVKSAHHLEAAAERTGAVRQAAQEIQDRTTTMTYRLKKLEDLAKELKDLRWLAETQARQAAAKLEAGSGKLIDVGVIAERGGKHIHAKAAQAKAEMASDEMAGIPFSLHSLDTAYRGLLGMIEALRVEVKQTETYQSEVWTEAGNTATTCADGAKAGRNYAQQYIDIGDVA